MTKNHELKGKGVFKVQIERKGKIIFDETVENIVVYDGENKMLDVHFRAATQLTIWYCGLVDNSGFTGSVNTDTMASHSGWTEFSSYAETVRQTWAPGAPASGSLTNGTVMTFTISATGSLNGIFITSSNTKGGTTGTLWSQASFSSPQTVNNTDIIRITYTFSLT